MRVISNKKLVAFSAAHPDSTAALQAWRKILEKSDPGSFADLKAMFNSVDRVGDLYVFDIKGNSYRIACRIGFGIKICFVTGVMTHTEYDRGKWK